MTDSPLPLSDAEQHPYDDEELEGAREAIEEFGDPWYPSARLLATIDRLRADLTAAQDSLANLEKMYGDLLVIRPTRGQLAERLEKAEQVERAAADIFRAITGGWGALQAIGPTHEQLAAYVTASNLAAPKEEQG